MSARSAEGSGEHGRPVPRDMPDQQAEPRRPSGDEPAPDRDEETTEPPGTEEDESAPGDTGGDADGEAPQHPDPIEPTD